MTYKSGNFVIAMLLATILLASGLTVLCGSARAYSIGGPYNIIEKTPEIQKVLRGQDLQFEEMASWSEAPVTVYRIAGGGIENTYTADATNRIFDVNWPATGAYYVNYVNESVFDAQLSIEDPRIPLALKVGTVEVASIAVGTRLSIDTGGINLFPDDRVDLVVIDPDGVQIKTDVNGQQFTNITVKTLTEEFGSAAGIVTSGWKLGDYSFYIETLPDHASGLALTSASKEMTAGRTSAPISSPSPTPPPTQIPSPTPAPTSTAIATPPTPSPTVTPSLTPAPTSTTTPTATPIPVATPTPQEPGFRAVFTITGLGALGYLLRKRKRR